jgi:transposase
MSETQLLSAKRLHFKGLSVQEIAYRLGVEISTVQDVLLSKSYVDSHGVLNIN